MHMCICTCINNIFTTGSKNTYIGISNLICLPAISKKANSLMITGFGGVQGITHTQAYTRTYTQSHTHT